ncbi:unnamed protein product [Rotaria sp. Silwood2]|nr:unnamed protein product [Rotaria sp. Silwood2]CAF3449309.1 unnamed protein product [Rotaria sp. Silwood2]CAF4151136.1 unnamed protein product [Rotaria sp. Silwood2]CAF4567662.1 unnamed protein product [Rotaria sp. Silwood2]
MSGCLDTYSAYVPGVVNINNYYNISYTLTANPNATHNQLFLAQSLIRAGTMKNGMALIELQKILKQYSNNNDLFTDLTMAQLNSTNHDAWPLNLQSQGHDTTRCVNVDADSTDVKWCPELQLFIGFTKTNRFFILRNYWCI